jgi:molybdopterin biosynthesis enzyme
VVALVGCSKGDNKVDSTTAMAPAAANTTSTAAATSTSAGAVATPIVLTDLAGTWAIVAAPTSGTDTTSTLSTLTATGTTTGWKTTYANGTVVPLVVTVAGDSVIVESAAPYKSVRRKGVMVTTHNVFRKEGNKLVGTATAHYKTKGADSVLVLKTEGTKKP